MKKQRYQAPDVRLPELARIHEVIGKLYEYARVKKLASVSLDGHDLPIHAIMFGPDDPTTPVFAIFGGVHGLERIGTELVLAWLNVIGRLLPWDKLLNSYLERARLIFVPLVNPGGMYLRRRSNPQGVDLMRNAPIIADTLPKLKLLAGHRISPRLPWFQGPLDAPMEIESAAVRDFAREHIYPAQCAVTLDVHSGFGTEDRIWFPYAKTTAPFPHVVETFAMFRLFNKTYPNHVYTIEPQSKSYTTHGDLWDYLYDEWAATAAASERSFIPLSLEMGSWAWVKKNPRQLFSTQGPFNPILPHRFARTMRRHMVLMDFLMRAVLSHDSWAHLEPQWSQALRCKAMRRWY